VVDKDRATPVHGGLGLKEESTLLFMLKAFLAERDGSAPDFLSPAHRIDMNTLGPVVFAKNRNSLLALIKAFSSGGILKTYRALVEGILSGPLFVQADVRKGGHKKALVSNLLVVKEHFPEHNEWYGSKDKSSTTISATLIYPEKLYDDITLCRVELWSGRYHQIRAICEAIGHPVCGDTKYNHDPRNHYHRKTSNRYPDGQMLLCSAIEIPALGLSVKSRFELKPADPAL
jgi:23S rRNA pseudouridine955/2504/2580 synthase